MPLTLGTAGHIDHGKTTLVEALTGVNTDRLPEEHERGISIELGYAQLELPSGRRLSVIDVPGHERFVRTMVAGASGIDLFLLVVDAKEGPRAQTYEHVEILRLLGVEHGVVAVTKTDLSNLVVNEVEELVPGAEVVLVSAVTGRGLDELRGALDRTAARVERPDRGDAARLYVDRVFSLPGAGTIATGTLWSGSISAGDRLDVLPAGFEARVRSVQVHGTQVERADAGQRVAVALTVERRRGLARGDALVTPGAYPVSYRLDVDLDGDVEGRVTLCHGTSAVPARIVKRDDERTQLRLEQPVVAARGDRFVLRREQTIGGGVVLDPAPPRRVNSAPARVSELRQRGIDLNGLIQEGEWAFPPEWIDGLRVEPGVHASTVFGDAPWAAAAVRVLGLETVGGRVYPKGQTPVVAESDEVKLGDGSLVSRDDYERMKALLVEECEREGTITLARFRDLIGESRRVAQLLLERLDSDRVTLRVGDARRLRRRR